MLPNPVVAHPLEGVNWHKPRTLNLQVIHCFEELTAEHRRRQTLRRCRSKLDVPGFCLAILSMLFYLRLTGCDDDIREATPCRSKRSLDWFNHDQEERGRRRAEWSGPYSGLCAPTVNLRILLLCP